MITIKEIAEQLGVSPTTISNVINGHTQKMSAETRQKVEEALIRNHYVNEPKNEEMPGELKLVTVEFCLTRFDRILTDPFCAELFESIQRELLPYGRYAVCGLPISGENKEEKICRQMAARNVEGAIVLGYSPEKCRSLTTRTQKPIVFIDSGEGDYDNIGLNDMEGACEITSYLLKQGHRKIAFFCDQPDPQASNLERFKGYQQALGRFGRTFSRKDYFYLPPEKNQRFEVLRQFAVKAKQEGYTAAFFVSDLLANEAISVFFSKDLIVPDDLSVTGFDDNIYASLSRPRLTTVRQSPQEKGREAVRLLLKRIYGQEVLVRSMHLPTELIVRESVRNIGL